MPKQVLTPEQKKERQREYCRRYYAKHGDRVRGYQAAYRQGVKTKLKAKKAKLPKVAKLPLFGTPYETFHDDYYNSDPQYRIAN